MCTQGVGTVGDSPLRVYRVVAQDAPLISREGRDKRALVLLAIARGDVVKSTAAMSEHSSECGAALRRVLLTK